jgi:hypothetical protein
VATSTREGAPGGVVMLCAELVIYKQMYAYAGQSCLVLAKGQLRPKAER